MATRDLHQRPLPLRLLGLLLIALAALVAAPAAFLLLLSPTEWMLWAAAASIVPLIALGSWLMVGD